MRPDGVKDRGVMPTAQPCADLGQGKLPLSAGVAHFVQGCGHHMARADQSTRRPAGHDLGRLHAMRLRSLADDAADDIRGRQVKGGLAAHAASFIG
jgi:hypothetical protein